MKKPLTDRSKVRNEQITVVVTVDEKKRAEKAAFELGVSLSTLVRFALKAYLKGSKGELNYD